MVWHSTFIVIGISAAGLNKNVLKKLWKLCYRYSLFLEHVLSMLLMISED